MGEYTDKIKGKAKQVVGDITGNEKLHAEGKKDELLGKAKGAVKAVENAAKAAVNTPIK